MEAYESMHGNVWNHMVLRMESYKRNVIFGNQDNIYDNVVKSQI